MNEWRKIYFTEIWQIRHCCRQRTSDSIRAARTTTQGPSPHCVQSLHEDVLATDHSVVAPSLQQRLASQCLLITPASREKSRRALPSDAFRGAFHATPSPPPPPPHRAHHGAQGLASCTHTSIGSPLGVPLTTNISVSSFWCHGIWVCSGHPLQPLSSENYLD